jgi:diguanylate cyclase (GGDEF)-like protein
VEKPPLLHTSNSVKYELLIIVIFNILMLLLFMEIDSLESIYHYASQHEHYELDEFIPLCFTLSISLTVFSLRRWQDGNKLLIKIHSIATQDHLTQLFNRRYIQEALQLELERSERTDSIFSIMVIDIDHFKSVNDTYGHNIGDQVLMEFSKILTDSVRTIDLVARWGGEEFLIICPETDINGAKKLGEKLLNAIRSNSNNNIQHVTASIGIACAGKSDTTESLIHKADDCLYQAKNTGRDSLVIYSD